MFCSAVDVGASLVSQETELHNVKDMADISVKKYQKVRVKSLWEYKTGSFLATF